MYYGDERPCEPPTKASKSAKVSPKPNYGNLGWDKVYRKPVYWVDGERCKGGMNIIQAFMWNVRTYGLMIREYIKQNKLQDKSTNVDIGADQVVVVKKFL